MKNKFLVLLFSSVLLLSCEGLQDDRNRPVPTNPSTTWLLSVELDRLPPFTDAFECIVERDTFRVSDIKLPTLLKIPGASLYSKGEAKKVTITTIYKDSITVAMEFDAPYEPHITIEPIKIKVDSIVLDTTSVLDALGIDSLVVIPITHKKDSIVFDTTYHYPQKVQFKDDLNLGIEGYFHYRYN